MKAVIVIDMQNDFFEKGLLFENRNSLTQNINNLVVAYREKGHSIIWIRQEFVYDLSDAFKVMREHNTSITIKGTHGSELLSELNVNCDDTVIIKKRYSAFFKTRLDHFLKENQVSELILCGINTHACVRMAAIDAYQRDYDIYIPSDCVCSNDLDHHNITLKYLGVFIAKVVHSNSMISRLTPRNTLSFTQATPDDYANIRNRAYNNMIDIVLPIWKEWKEEAFKECFSDRSNYIVHADGVAIGHIGLKVEDNTLRIQDIQIDSDHQSQGYGKQCMEWIEGHAEDINCAQLKLVVFKSNTIAYGFYSRLGFRVENELEHSFVLTKNAKQAHGGQRR